jgi:hypothetical protein
LGTAGRWFESSCPDQKMILNQIFSCHPVDNYLCRSSKMDASEPFNARRKRAAFDP